LGAAPFGGVLVVSLEQAVAGPMASQRLAEAGARVIKIERPEGDFARGYDKAANGVASYFAWLNRGKESIALDLRQAAEWGLLRHMISKADVFIQNLGHGATARMGLGATALRADQPGLIVCDISGYGAEGPRATAKAYDLLVQAESGLISVSGAPGAEGRIGVSVADIATGTNAALAISQALARKARTGEGAHIQVSLFDTLAEWMTVPLLHHDYLGQAPAPAGLAHPSIAPYGAFTCADGERILISIQSDREWRVLARLIERDEMATDPDFATNNARVANRAATDGAVACWFAGQSVAEAERALDEHRIAYGRLNSVAGLSVHPQLRRSHHSHGLGSVDLPASALRCGWSAEDADVPDLDQQGSALRAEFGVD